MRNKCLLLRLAFRRVHNKKLHQEPHKSVSHETFVPRILSALHGGANIQQDFFYSWHKRLHIQSPGLQIQLLEKTLMGASAICYYS